MTDPGDDYGVMLSFSGTGMMFSIEEIIFFLIFRISVPGVLLSSDSTEVNFTKELSKKELLALGARFNHSDDIILTQLFTDSLK